MFIRVISFFSRFIIRLLSRTKKSHISKIEWFKKQIDYNGNVLISKIKKPPLLFTGDFVQQGFEDCIYIRGNFFERDNRKIILFNKESSDFPINLIRLISTCFVHGNTDTVLNFKIQLDILKKRNLSIKCGNASQLTKLIVANQSIDSRVVSVLTLEEWNDYDNGHTMLEVFSDVLKKWVLVDVDTKSYFSVPGTKYASLLEIAVSKEMYSRMPLSKSHYLDYSGSLNEQIFMEYQENNLDIWFKKMFQAFAILDDNSDEYVFLNTSKTESRRIESYSSRYKVLEINDFKEKFYK